MNQTSYVKIWDIVRKDISYPANDIIFCNTFLQPPMMLILHFCTMTKDISYFLQLFRLSILDHFWHSFYSFCNLPNYSFHIK